MYVWFFLDSTVLDRQLFVPGYSVVRKDRASLGGGLVLYITDNLCCYRRTDIESENIESLVRVQILPMLLCYSYKPPSSKVEWLNNVSESLDTSFNENKETVILGEFNFDLLKLSHNSNSWLQLVESMNFTQLVKCPTRTTACSSTLIYHVFTNISGNIIEINIPYCALVDHFPVAITRKCNHNIATKPYHIYLIFIDQLNVLVNSNF